MTTETAKWYPVVFLVLLMLILQLIGPDLFRYEARSITDLEFWRLFTGHWVHANWIHFLMNMAGFLLCIALTGVTWSLWQWSWRIVVLSAGISLVFYLVQNNISWYVGFSGVLFGLYVLAAYASLREQTVMSVILLVIISLKISLEQWSSVTITSSGLIGIPVLVDAHLYGVLVAASLIIVQTGYRIIFKINIVEG